MTKNITFSLPEELVSVARSRAKQDATTLTKVAANALEAYIAERDKLQREAWLKAFRKSVKDLSFTSDRKYTREEMNER